VLSLFRHSDLGLDAGIDPTPRSPTEFSSGHNVSSEAEVDQVMARAAKAGARITMPARKTFWGGYAGYFQDPDGHLWVPTTARSSSTWSVVRWWTCWRIARRRPRPVGSRIIRKWRWSAATVLASMRTPRVRARRSHVRPAQAMAAGVDQHPLADGGLELARRGCGPVLDVLASMDHGPRPRRADRDRPL